MRFRDDAVTYFADRYGGARYDGATFVILVKGLTPLDHAWVEAKSDTGAVRLEATADSAEDIRRAQEVVGAELAGRGIEAWSTGQRDGPTLAVVVEGHHEGLEARLRSLVEVPMTYEEVPVGSFRN